MLTLIFQFAIAGAVAILSFEFLPPILPSFPIAGHLIQGRWLDIVIPAVIAFFLVGGLLERPAGACSGKAIVRLAGLAWDTDSFCRHWLITGRTGSGKSASGIANILVQILQNVPTAGALLLDQKGDLWQMVKAACHQLKQAHRLALIQVRPSWAGEDWKPPLRMNLIGDPRLLPTNIADVLVDSAVSRKAISSDGSGAHFVSQTKIHIAKAVEFYRALGETPTISKIYYLLTDIPKVKTQVERLRNAKHPASRSLYDHFVSYTAIAGDELSGIKGTISNTLFFYCEPELEEVFSSDNANFKIQDIDQGKIICLAIPQKFKAARQLINTLIKLQFFEHGMERYDLPPGEIAKKNMLVGFFDEAQRAVSKSELGSADHNNVDQLRAAKVALIYSTQTERSFIPALGRDVTNTLVDNLSNEIIFTQTNKEDAENASKRIGERKISKSQYSYNRGTTTRSVQEKIEAFIRPDELRTLKKFHCVIRHCEQGWKRTKLNPTPYTKPVADQSMEEYTDEEQSIDTETVSA